MNFDIGAVSKLVVRDTTESLLHYADSDNFELYVIALELRDDENVIDPVEELMVFPVNPDSIMRVQRTLANVKKSAGGVHVVDNETFVPFAINLSGTFGGKKFKLLLGSSLFDFSLKTGFGVTRRLKDIVDKSKAKATSNGNPYRLILHLLPFNESFTVIVNECRYSQSMDRNRIWHYDLNLMAVAPPGKGGIGETWVDSLRLTVLQKIINSITKRMP
jgi:hypothetical protein